MKYYHTREEAEQAWSDLVPVEGYVDEHAKLAKEYDKRSAGSFRNCDGLNTRKERSIHEIKMHGGQYFFPVLVDINTNEVVSTKLFTFKYNYSYGNRHVWLVNGEWITDYKRESSFTKKGLKRESSFTKKGLKRAWVLAPAYVSSTDTLDKTPTQYGFSGLTSVNYMTLMNRKNIDV